MVSNITSLTGNGLRDWMVQRVSAVVVGAYAIFLIGYLLMNPGMQYAQWHGLFTNLAMRTASFLVLLSLLAHAWIGVWTVSTDYIKPTALRVVFQVLVILALLACLVWGIEILWGI